MTTAALVVLAVTGASYAGYHYFVRGNEPERSVAKTAEPSETRDVTSRPERRPTAAPPTAVAKPESGTPPAGERPPAAPRATSEAAPPSPQAALTARPQATPPPPSPASAPRQSDVRITSNPVGARVFLDGEMRGESPATLANVLWGDHKVRLEKDGYSALEQAVTVDRPGLELSWDLRLCSGQIVVKTDPPGAAVMIGGTFEGNSPVAKALKCGRHSLTARMSAHEELRQTILVRDGAEEFLLALKLRPGAVRPTPLVPPTAVAPSPSPMAAVAPAPSAAPSGPAPSAGPASSTASALPAVASVPPLRTATLNLTTSGFEVTSGLPAVLTLGLLTSQYAVELDGKLVVDWSLRTVETSLQVAPGDYRLRILVRNALVRLGDPVHDARINVSAERPTTVDVKFLGSTVAVNGVERPFTFKNWQNQRRPLE